MSKEVMINFIVCQGVPYDEVVRYSYERLRMVYDYYQAVNL